MKGWVASSRIGGADATPDVKRAAILSHEPKEAGVEMAGTFKEYGHQHQCKKAKTAHGPGARSRSRSPRQKPIQCSHSRWMAAAATGSGEGLARGQASEGKVR